VDVILEHLLEASPPATSLGIRRCSIIVISVVHPTLAFSFVFVLYFDVIYLSDSMPFMFLQYEVCRHDPLVLQGFESSVGSILPDKPLLEFPTVASQGPGAN
jgi:hypothetical protein